MMKNARLKPQTITEYVDIDDEDDTDYDGFPHYHRVSRPNPNPSAVVYQHIRKAKGIPYTLSLMRFKDHYTIAVTGSRCEQAVAMVALNSQAAALITDAIKRQSFDGLPALLDMLQEDSHWIHTLVSRWWNHANKDDSRDVGQYRSAKPRKTIFD